MIILNSDLQDNDELYPGANDESGDDLDYEKLSVS